MNSRQRRKRAKNIERHPVPEDSLFEGLGCDWQFMRLVDRARRHADSGVDGLWLGHAASHRHHLRYRARMGR